MNSLTNSNNKENKVSTNKLIFFNSISNICFISSICFSLLINNYNNMAWIVLIGVILLTILFSLFFKGFTKDFDVIKYVKKNIFLKICIILYLIIIITLVSITSTLIIKKYFSSSSGVLLLTSLTIITALLLSKNRLKNILDISVFFLILVLLLYIPTFFTLEDRYLRYLFPIDFEIKQLNLALIIMIFPLENSLMFIFNNQTENGIKRKHFIIANVFTLLYLLFIVIDSLSLLSANFLMNLKFSGFYRWHLFSGNKFIQNYDIFLFMIIIITVIFRLSYYFNIFRIILLAPQTKSTYIIFFLFFFALIYILFLNINNIINIISKVLYFLFFIILLIYLSFVKKSMEVNNDK